MSELVDSQADGASLPAPRWQQALLPGALREQEGYRRSPRDWLVDVVMFLLAIGIGAYLLALSWHEHGELGQLLDLLLGIVCCCALWWRRQHPVAVAVFTGVCGIFAAGPAGAGLIALFSAVIRVPWRTLVPLWLIGVAAAIVFPAIYPSTTETYSTELLMGILVTGIAIGWGLFVRVQRQLVRSLQDRTVQLESEQRLRVEQAREAERRRIAREMHDVLAHRVSLLSLHAGALEFRPDAPPQEIAQAAGVVRASARAALEDLREVIGVLREPDGERDGAGGVGAGEEGAPEPPQPTLVQIPALVERSRAAGMRVGCRIELGGLDGEAVGDVLGRTAYRVVQEGLTNAHKHAPAAAVEVRVEARACPDRDDARLVVEVVSRRPVGTPPATGVVAAGGELLPGTGTGLVGLGERVALAGGELEHGPDARGDFVLRATLPWAASLGVSPPRPAEAEGGAA